MGVGYFSPGRIEFHMVGIDAESLFAGHMNTMVSAEWADDEFVGDALAISAHKEWA